MYSRYNVHYLLHTAHLGLLALLLDGAGVSQFAFHENRPVRKVFRVDFGPYGTFTVKFNEFLVHAPRLWVAEAAVLVKDRRQ